MDNRGLKKSKNFFRKKFLLGSLPVFKKIELTW
jgi:hypothetical protein